MKQITFSAIIGSIRAKVDRSIGASFTTPELTPVERSYFFELMNQNVQMTITPIDEKVEEYKVEKDLDQKPASVRMRNVLWLLWKQDPEGHTDFNAYYREKMEKAIEFYKSKLDQ